MSFSDYVVETDSCGVSVDDMGAASAVPFSECALKTEGCVGSVADTQGDQYGAVSDIAL